MDHSEVEQGEIVERYLRHQLGPDERLSFQEHFFVCDQCFDDLQLTSRLIAGVNASSRSGALSHIGVESAESRWIPWLRPLFVTAMTAFIALAATLGWVMFRTLPGVKSELAQQRQANELLTRQNDLNLQSAREELERTRKKASEERATLEAQSVAQVSPGVNIPLVILDSTRDSKSGTEYRMSRKSNALILWIEVNKGDHYSSFQVRIFDSAGRMLRTVSGLTTNAYGALALSVPSSQLPPGRYLITLIGAKDGRQEMVGEYPLTLRH